MLTKIEVKPTSNLIQTSQNLFLKLKKLNKLFANIPFDEKLKRKLINEKLKYKSAWYASIVNPLIEINLIPDYLQSENCTNLLLKKETEIYFKSIGTFNWLKDKNNVELYENILVEDSKKIKTDLFNTSKASQTKCPDELLKYFEDFRENICLEDEILTNFYLFFNWHRLNKFNFENQHQIVLWLNFKLFEMFGQIAFLFPIEDFLYHHCQKSGREISLLISDLILYLSKNTDKLTKELKAEFQNNIQFNSLNSKQKIVSMHLFNSCFETDVESQIYKNRNLKLLFQKGYLKFENKFEYEILDDLTVNYLNKLYETDKIECETDNKNLYFYLKTNLIIENEWLKYKNAMPNIKKINYDEMIFNYTKPQIKTTPINSSSYETNYEIKKKAFFG